MPRHPHPPDEGERISGVVIIEPVCSRFLAPTKYPFWSTPPWAGIQYRWVMMK